MKKTKFTMNSTIKKIVLASSASIIIGLAFGTFFLQMIKQEESTAIVMEDIPKSIDSNDELRELAEIDVFVIQGGVFSDLENYQNWESKYSNLGFEVINWERDGTYHLLAGIAQSETSAKQMASKLVEKELDVFVKQWHVSKSNVDLSQMEYEWIIAFVDLWHTSILGLEENAVFPYEEWEGIIYQRGEELVRFDVLNDEIQKITKDKPKEVQSRLLNMLKEYEHIIENN